MTNYYMTEKEQQFLTVAHIDKTSGITGVMV